MDSFGGNMIQPKKFSERMKFVSPRNKIQTNSMDDD
jgi:hypothetical protein